MSEFKVAPFDQHLYLNNCAPFERSDNDKTLAQLNIFPDSVLSLVVSFLCGVFHNFVGRRLCLCVSLCAKVLIHGSCW